MENRAYEPENGEISLRNLSSKKEDDNKLNGRTAVATAGSSKPNNEVPTEEVNLKRRLGLASAVSFMVGSVIGSGIFVSPAGVLSRTGSPGLSLVAWGLCGVISLLGALSYAELGTLVTASGGEYAYYLEGFSPSNRKKTWYGPIPAFLYSWIAILILKPAASALVALTAAEYISRLFRLGCDPTNDDGWIDDKTLAVKLIAATIVIIIAFINSWSIKWATNVQMVCTVVKLVAVFVIIVAGIVRLAQGHTETFEKTWDGSITNAASIATSFYSGLFAYESWNNINYVMEELKNPVRNLPLALLTGIPLITFCYVMMNVAYFTTMGPQELLSSNTVAVIFGGRVFGTIGEILVIVSVSFSTFGTINGNAFTSGRIVFASAREGHVADFLSYINKDKRTPAPAVMLIQSLALILIIPSNIRSLMDFFSFTAYIFYGGSMVALFVMRFTKKDDPRPIKIPLIIPALFLAICIWLVFLPIIQNPQMEYLYAFLFILAGLIFYFPFVLFKKSIPGMEKLTELVQIILQVIPTNSVDEDK